MRKGAMIAAVAAIPLMTGGCVRTAASVVTAPFKAAGQVVDWTTTAARCARKKRRKAASGANGKSGAARIRKIADHMMAMSPATTIDRRPA